MARVKLNLIDYDLKSDLRVIAKRIEQGNEGEGDEYPDRRWCEIKREIRDLAIECATFDLEEKQRIQEERATARRTRVAKPKSDLVSSAPSVVDSASEQSVESVVKTYAVESSFPTPWSK